MTVLDLACAALVVLAYAGLLWLVVKVGWE